MTTTTLKLEADEEGADHRARDRYRGERGRAYYRQLDADEFSRGVIARERVRKIQPFVGPADRVLEYGVGCGYNLRFLRCAERWGYDLNEAGRAACEEAGIEFVTDRRSIDKRAFDVVICHHVLEHVPDPLATLREIEEYLRAGGRLLLFVPLETRRRYRSFDAGDPNHHLYSWNVQSLGNLLALTGSRTERIEVRPFSYERRLAFLARWGMPAYRLGLAALRRLRREDEICAVLTVQAARPVERPLVLAESQSPSRSHVRADADATSASRRKAA